MAAGYLMVIESGGMVTTVKGEKFSIYNNEVVSSNGLIHKDMLEVLGEGQ
jgi:myo-inositol-1(or 4)-monophosphatase